MKGLRQKSQQVSDTDSVASNSSFIMSEKDLQRSRRKKKAAFQSFLVMPQPDEDSFPRKRKFSNHEMEQQTLEVPDNCKICNKILRDKVKVCDFCKDTMCISHFRKARLNLSTKKFSRICDYCEDKKLIERHFQNLIKTEETIISEEMVTQQKYNRVKLQLERKKIKLQMMRDKQKDMQQLRKAKQNSIMRAEKQLQRQWKEVLRKIEQNKKRQQTLNNIQVRLPHSEQKDYKMMQNQKEKVTKILNKIKRQCESIMKAKISLQKKMYEDLYQWQLIQTYKIKQDKKKMKEKAEDCNIY